MVGACKFLPIPALAALVLAAGPWIFTGCIFDERIVSKSDETALPPLGLFTGTTHMDSLSASFADKWNKIRNPRIAIVWQFLLGEVPAAITAPLGQVSTSPPFDFEGELFLPPPPAVYTSNEVAVAGFWLYSDVDGNGRLDALVHPDLQRHYDTLNNLKAAFNQRSAELLALADFNRSGVEVQETYFLTGEGRILRSSDSAPVDIPIEPRLGLAFESHPSLLAEMIEVLKLKNKWERFFQQRQRANQDRVISRKGDAHAQEMTFFYQRRLIPKPGQEAVFYRKLSETAAAKMAWNAGVKKLAQNPSLSIWREYPYQPDGGHDWVAGRSTWFQLAYYPSDSAAREAVDAEASSSFEVAGLGNLRHGYNLIRFDNQYAGAVLPWPNRVIINLGPSYRYFDPPSSLPLIPQPRASVSTAPAESLDPLQGRYSISPFEDLEVLRAHQALWVHLPRQGLFRLVQSDAVSFFSPIAPIILRFVRDSTPFPPKVFLFQDRAKISAVRRIGHLPSPELYPRMAMLSADSVPVEEVAFQPHRGTFVFGAKDSLHVDLLPDGPGLQIRLPGLRPSGAKVTLREDGRFRSPEMELELDFKTRIRNQDQIAVCRLEGRTYHLFRKGYSARTLSEYHSRPVLVSPRPFSRHDGSKKDPYRGWDRKTRYSCSGDSLFLAPGNGALTVLGDTLSKDGISLSAGLGRAQWKITGQKDQWIRLKLRGCAEEGTTTHAMVLTGGPESSEGEVLSDEGLWTVSAAGSDTLFDPLPVRTDPYYLTLRLLDQPGESSLEARSRIALDSYELSAE